MYFTGVVLKSLSMKRLLLIILIASFASAARTQSAADTGFARQKQYIDSLTLSIDNNKQLTANLFTGELMYGSFRANCYYMVGSGIISKMECFFNDSTAGKKILYYNQENIPVKISDRGQLYYYADNKLFHPDGRPVKPYIAKDMVFFSQEISKLLLAIMN